MKQDIYRHQMREDIRFHQPDLSNNVNIRITFGKAPNFLTLNSMCTAFRKVPNITNLELIHLIIPILIHSRNQNFSSIDKSPFCLRIMLRFDQATFENLDLPLYANEVLSQHLSPNAAAHQQYHYWLGYQ